MGAATAPPPGARVLTEAELVAAGEALGAGLAPGAVVWLSGDLGAGKTTLVQAITRGLGVAGTATSPTYSLVHRYESPGGPVFHVDCYRLRRADEAADLDWAGLAASRALLVEWPERAGAWAVPPSHRVELGHLADPARRWVKIGEGT